jgi:glycosyltransferase involved in cell wall biosynthesis
VLVIDNGSTDITPTAIRSWQRQDYRGIGSKISRAAMPGRSIYEMWNHGFYDAARGSRNRPTYVLVSNNDIELPPRALAALKAPLAVDPLAWASYPDYDAPDAPWAAWAPTGWRETTGVYGDGGMFGACFMLAAHRIPWRPLVTDLTYEWWYGDNHLAAEIEQHGGKQVRVGGLPVRHVNEATASKLDESVLYGMKYRDRHRWVTRYERNA